MFRYVTLLLLFVLCGDIYAAYDAELANSLRCVSLFKYHEQKYRIPRDTLHSISLQETGRLHSKHKVRIVWPWTVNVEGAGHFFDTKKEAVNFVKQQLAKGASSIDVGCMQVNLKHHPRAFRSLDEAFEPRTNIAYGAQFLRSKYEQVGNWHKAIAHYHSATEHLGSKYKDNVIKIARNIDQNKDLFRKYARNSTANTEYNRAVERGHNKMFANNVPNAHKKYRSKMMVHVPRQHRAY